MLLCDKESDQSFTEFLFGEKQFKQKKEPHQTLTTKDTTFGWTDVTHAAVGNKKIHTENFACLLMMGAMDKMVFRSLL